MLLTAVFSACMTSTAYQHRYGALLCDRMLECSDDRLKRYIVEPGARPNLAMCALDFEPFMMDQHPTEAEVVTFSAKKARACLSNLPVVACADLQAFQCDPYGTIVDF